MKSKLAWQHRGRLFVGKNDLVADKKRLIRWLSRNLQSCPKAVHVRDSLEQINAELRAISALEQEQVEFCEP